MIERDYGDDEEHEKLMNTVDKDVKVPDSKLPAQVQDLIRLIFNTEMMTAAMIEIGYDGTILTWRLSIYLCSKEDATRKVDQATHSKGLRCLETALGRIVKTKAQQVSLPNYQRSLMFVETL